MIKCITLCTEGRVANQYTTKSIAVGQMLGGYRVESMARGERGVMIAAGANKVEIPEGNIATIEYE